LLKSSDGFAASQTAESRQRNERSGRLLDKPGPGVQDNRALIFAVTDPLTGLYKRRGFMALADQQMKTAARTSKKMSLLFIRVSSGRKRSKHLDEIF